VVIIENREDFDYQIAEEIISAEEGIISAEEGIINAEEGIVSAERKLQIIQAESGEKDTAEVDEAGGSSGVRKKVREEKLWKRIVRKAACNSGLEYTTAAGKVKEARKMREECGERCMYGCQSNTLRAPSHEATLSRD